MKTYFPCLLIINVESSIIGCALFEDQLARLTGNFIERALNGVA